MNATQVRKLIRAPRPVVYRALLSAEAVERWRVPGGMRCEVHTFEPKVGGAFRVSLTYESAQGAGKTTSQTDTYHGRFVELVEDQRVVELVQFETADPALQGVMRITTTLGDDGEGGTDLLGVHEGLPPGLSVEANEEGWREALERLASLVEQS